MRHAASQRLPGRKPRLLGNSLSPNLKSPPRIVKRLNWQALTSSPRLGGSLMTGLLANGIRLPLVLGHSGVNLLDDIRADGAQEYGRVRVRRTGGSAIGADDRDGRSGSHFFPRVVNWNYELTSGTDWIIQRDCLRAGLEAHLGVCGLQTNFVARGL